MEVELIHKPCDINIAYTKYNSDLRLFELDYDRLYYEWFKDAIQIPPTNVRLIPHGITIKNPITTEYCVFQLTYYEGDTNVDVNEILPNEIARFAAWHGDPNELYYQLSITKPIAEDQENGGWVDMSDAFNNTWKPYIPTGVDPYNDAYIDADDIGKVYNGNSSLDADMMMKIAEWYSRVK